MLTLLQKATIAMLQGWYQPYRWNRKQDHRARRRHGPGVTESDA
jgi:hypothetical protein